MTNEEIADFIAEKVMKWTQVPHVIDYLRPPKDWFYAEDKPVIKVRDWQPATDLNQAAQAAEKVFAGGSFSVDYRGTYKLPYAAYGHRSIFATPTPQSGTGDFEADTPADALARAVVKAAGGDDA